VGATLLLLLWLLLGGSGFPGAPGATEALSATTTTGQTAQVGQTGSTQHQVSSEVLPPAATQDPKAAADRVPAVGGKSVILVNMDDGRVIYERNADEQRSIASTTKIMTGIIALETLPLDKIVTASAKATDAGESEIWMEPGEQLSVGDLMKALLVRSANDAAVALAEAAGGSLDAFVEKMNAKAAELVLINTHFANPHGLEAKEHYSSARDLAKLARYAMQNEEFRKLVATAKVNIPWPGRPYDRVLKNRNDLVGAVQFVTGVKSGYTAKAGYCLVGSGARDGASLVSVILGEDTKAAVDADTVSLLEYGFTKYRQVSLMEEGVPVAAMDVPYHFGEKVVLKTERNLVRTVYSDDPITKTVVVQDRLVLPVSQGQVLGKITFATGTAVAGEVDLVSDRAIEAPTLRVKLRYVWDRMINWLGKAV